MITASQQVTQTLVPVTNKRSQIVAYLVVDPADFDRTSKLRWHLTGRGYVRHTEPRIDGGGSQKQISIHRFILNDQEIPEGYEVDHINANKLDNRRSNLRIVEPRFNAWHKVETGVNKRKNGWYVTVKRDGIEYALGTYIDRDEAQTMHDAAAKVLLGEFAHVDFDLAKRPDLLEKIEHVIELRDKGLHGKNTTGYTSISKSKTGRFNVTFRNLDRKRVYVGTFKTLDEAVEALAEAKLDDQLDQQEVA